MNHSFKSKLETIQYHAALAISGAIRGSSMEKLFNELGIEYLADRRWLRRLTFFYKIQNGSAPTYLNNIIPQYITPYMTRNQSTVRNFSPRTDLFSSSFFPYSIRIWNSLDPAIREHKSVSLFKNSLLKFIRPSPSPIYGIHHPLGLKLVSRLRIGLSHLRDHKFRHSFRDTVNPLCSCNIEPESTTHFLLRCRFFSAERKVLFDSLSNIDVTLTTMNHDKLKTILLYGSTLFSTEVNSEIIKVLVKFILSIERFNENLI